VVVIRTHPLGIEYSFLIYLVGLDYVLISNWRVKLNVLNASSSELHNFIYSSL